MARLINTNVVPAIAIASDLTPVSTRIHQLAKLGLERTEIVKALTTAGYTNRNHQPIRYQHVRNVLVQQAA